MFRGSWAVLADPRAPLDDGLALKMLHEVVMGLGTYIE